MSRIVFLTFALCAAVFAQQQQPLQQPQLQPQPQQQPQQAMTNTAQRSDASGGCATCQPGYLPDYQGDKYTNLDRIRETQELNKKFFDSIGGAPAAPPNNPAQQETQTNNVWDKYARGGSNGSTTVNPSTSQYNQNGARYNPSTTQGYNYNQQQQGYGNMNYMSSTQQTQQSNGNTPQRDQTQFGYSNQLMGYNQPNEYPMQNGYPTQYDANPCANCQNGGYGQQQNQYQSQQNSQYGGNAMYDCANCQPNQGNYQQPMQYQSQPPYAAPGAYDPNLCTGCASQQMGNQQQISRGRRFSSFRPFGPIRP